MTDRPSGTNVARANMAIALTAVHRPPGPTLSSLQAGPPRIWPHLPRMVQAQAFRPGFMRALMGPLAHIQEPAMTSSGEGHTGSAPAPLLYRETKDPMDGAHKGRAGRAGGHGGCARRPYVGNNRSTKPEYYTPPHARSPIYHLLCPGLAPDPSCSRPVIRSPLTVPTSTRAQASSCLSFAVAGTYCRMRLQLGS